MRVVGYRKGPAQETENTMSVFLLLEASQPNGSTYRLGIGCSLHPRLASMIALLARLF
jgi:hypothetical protein